MFPFVPPLTTQGSLSSRPFHKEVKLEFRTCHPRWHRKLGLEMGETGLARACPLAPPRASPTTPGTRGWCPQRDKGRPPVGQGAGGAQGAAAGLAPAPGRSAQVRASWLSPHSCCPAPHPGQGRVPTLSQAQAAGDTCPARREAAWGPSRSGPCGRWPSWRGVLGSRCVPREGPRAVCVCLGVWTQGCV